MARITIPVEDQAVTAINDWRTIATCELPTSNGNFVADRIWLIGKGPSNQLAFFQGVHRGKIISSTVTFVGTLISIVSFATGSTGEIYSSAQARLIQSGSALLLQVKAGVSTSTTWYGGFTLIVN